MRNYFISLSPDFGAQKDMFRTADETKQTDSTSLLPLITSLAMILISQLWYLSDIEKNGGKQRLLRMLEGLCSQPHAQIEAQYVCVQKI